MTSGVFGLYIYSLLCIRLGQPFSMLNLSATLRELQLILSVTLRELQLFLSAMLRELQLIKFQGLSCRK
jgi:hypothetical protein